MNGLFSILKLSLGGSNEIVGEFFFFNTLAMPK